MNRIYRLIWSTRLNTWMVVAENARAKGKGGRTASRTLAMLCLALPVYAAPIVATQLPTGGRVAAGQATIQQSGARMDVNQSTPRGVINWSTFNVGAQAQVNFNQPSTTSVTLNRVQDSNPSQIFGSLNANGQVFVVNPNGVLFGSSAQANVGGLVASTLNLNDADFMAGKYSFSLPSSPSSLHGGAVVNQGTLTAAQGGYIALLAPEVRNEGVISATLGTALLAAGDKITLNLNNGSALTYRIDQGTFKALVENKQLIQADGGQVFMSAKAADTLSGAIINNTGTIQARTLQNVGGTIKLIADMQVGIVNVGGTLDASALPSPAGGRGAGGEGGGFIETSAAHVKIAPNAHITTAAANGLAGTWLIDPIDFTIAAAGGDMTGAALSNSLLTTGVIILSTTGTVNTTTGLGDVNVNDVVSWSANKLTLNAQNNININANLNGSGTASLALEYGQQGLAAGNFSNYFVNAAVNLPAGQNFSTKLGSNGVITPYTVITTLGAAGSVTATDLQGINGGVAGNYVLGDNIDAAVTSTWNAGAGFMPSGNVTDMFGNAIAKFKGTFDGLGHAISNLVINRPTTNFVGLIGQTDAGSVIRNVGMIGGSINGAGNVANLVGTNNGTISNSYATGGVTGASNWVGGLVGTNYGTISNSYAIGGVIGMGMSMYVGGLVGYNAGTISNSYATGNVGGSQSVGGLVGSNATGRTISNSYARGVVSGTSGVGGILGENFGILSNSFWDTMTSGQTIGIGRGSSLTGATGLTTAQMQTPASFTGFVFTTIPGAAGNNWVIVDGAGTLNGAAGGGTYPMLASEYATTINNAHQLQLMTMAPAASYTLGGNINALSTGNSTDVWGAAGFAPVGASSVTPFTGTFDGLGHTITNFVINRPATSNVGLFGYTGTGSVISNVGMVGGSVSGANYVGILAGYAIASISNSYATGSVTGTSDVGGLVGLSWGSISNSYATGNTNGSFYIGGLVGYSYLSKINNSYATGSVTGGSYAGGLAGWNRYDTISNSYATGAVTGTSNVGGLVGNNGLFGSGTISNSYATGVVTGTSNVGGLVGIQGAGTVSNSYATGNVTGTTNVGGLVGSNAGSISTSYATGNVSGAASTIGSLAGTYLLGATSSSNYATGTVFDRTWSFFMPNQVVGIVSSNGGILTGATPLTTAQLQQQINLAGFDFNKTWVMYNGLSNPLLRSFMTGIKVTANNATQTYNGIGYAGGNGWTNSAPPTGVSLLGTPTYSGTSQGALNAGTYAIMPGGFSLVGGTVNQQGGVFIDYIAGTLTINPAIVSMTGTQVYNGTPNVAANSFTLSGLVGTETLSLTGIGTLADKNVGINKAVTLGTLALGNGTGLASNYTFTGGTDTANITPASITITGITAANKVYDATTAATINAAGATATGAFIGDVLNVAVTGLFADKNVAVGKVVTLTSTYTGADVANYTITNQASTTANITPASITITGITAANKVYDATTAATVNAAGATATGAFIGDVVNVAVTGVFADKNVAAGKVVTLTSTYTGADVANYTITSQASTTANITAANLAVTGITAANKVYDATTAVTVNTAAATLTGLIAGDVVNVAATGVFADKNVAAGKAVALTSSYTGLDVANYAITNQASTTANITPASLSVTGITAANKVYNANTAATVNTAAATLTGLIAGDVVNVTATGVFADKNVAAGKTVALASTYTGADVANYTITSQASTTANITPASLAVASIAATKTFDGTAYTGGNGVSYTGLVNGETAAVLGGILSYGGTAQNAVNVGTYLIVPSGLSAGNYNIVYIRGSLTVNPAPVIAAPLVIVLPTIPTPLVPLVTPMVDPFLVLPRGASPLAATPTVDPFLVLPTWVTPPVATPPVATPIAATPIAATPIATIPIATIPIAATPIATTPTAANPIAVSPVKPLSPAAIAALSQSLSGGDQPMQALDALSGNRVQLAIATGMNPALAARVGNTYSTVLAQQLSQGAPMQTAVAHAEQVFTAEANFPPQAAQVAAVKSLVADSNQLGSKLDNLASAQTPAGAAAFDQALSSALLKGVTFDAAIKVAQAAVVQADMFARADNSPQSQLANSHAMPMARSAVFDKTLSALLAKGNSMEQAMLQATQWSDAVDHAAVVDARSPAVSLASGNLAALEKHVSEPVAGKALSSVLARGIPLAEALVRVQKIIAFELQAARMEARNPATGFANGHQLPAQSDAYFDRALGNAIARGLSPAQALAQAQRATASIPKPTPDTALASGEHLESLPLGNSRIFKQVLGHALAKGMSPKQSLVLAQRAENANTSRFALSVTVLKQAAGKPLNITLADGRPLPKWLRFDAKSNTLLAAEVPDGELPLWVNVQAAKQTFKVEISEGGATSKKLSDRTAH